MDSIKDGNRIVFDYNKLPKTIKHGRECFDYDKIIGTKVNFCYKDINDYFIIESVSRKNNSYQITINYNDGLYTTNVSNFKNGNFYRGILRYLYKYNIGDVVGNNRILKRKCKEIKYKSQKSYARQYYCKCLKCGYEGWKFESVLHDSSQCSVCDKSPKIVVEGINDIPTTAPWMIPYFQGGYNEAKQYTKCSHFKIKPICPFCRNIKNKKIAISNIYYSNGISCACNDNMSYPNKLMYNILKIKNIEFISEFSPAWIKPKRYDFYIPSKNIIIEMDGGWHYINNNLSGKSKEESHKIDFFKDTKAFEHNITVYRIDCKKSDPDYIYDSIVKSDLNLLLSISRSEIMYADSLSHSNLVKEVCAYKNNHNNMTSSTVAKHFNLCRDTVQIYIKIGVKYGWCKPFKPYLNYKCVLLSKDGIDVGIFKNAERVSIYLKHKNNIDIPANQIRRFVLDGIDYKGFSFKDLDQKQTSYFLQSDFNWDCMIFQNDIMQKLLK